jgi:transposase
MPRPRVVMRKIREVLRLTLGERLSQRRVRQITGVPEATIYDYLKRAAAAGLAVWPLPKEVDDRELERRMFVSAGPPPLTRPLPDWTYVKKELRRKGVTLQLLHLEYLEEHPDGYQYSQFCRHYHAWRRRLDVVLRQDYVAGQKMFVDFPGETVPIHDRETETVVMEAQIFVSVLGASNYIYAEALPSQQLVPWVNAHAHAFTFYGGCPEIAVPDNLPAGVTKAHRYEPIVNESYLDMAAHFGVAVVPARPYKPRDKAKAESAVLVVERWILARLRNHRFYSLGGLNVEIRRLVVTANLKPFKKLPGSRQSVFDEVERAALRSLPTRPYEFAVFQRGKKVHIDYHVEVDGHYYSVPYQHTGERVDIRLTASVVEIFLRGRRIASHLRSYVRGRHTTDPAHRPESHRRHLEWPPERIVSWAEKTGPETAAMVKGVMESRPHPEQGYRTCLGIIRLGKRYGEPRLEAACRRALSVRALSYRSVESILKNGLDRKPLPERGGRPLDRRHHENLRGPDYYQ